VPWRIGEVLSQQKAEEIALLLELREEVRHLRAAVADLKRQLAAPDPIAISVEEAATRLGCGRTQVFKYLKEGRLRRARKLSRRVMVTVESIEALSIHQPAQEKKRPMRSLSQRKATSLRTAILALPLTGGA
jgi:predicted DNA-binding transcriptional regulator AlpA